jgi:hypothetical protein
MSYMTIAARHGRPEMTVAFCLLLSMIALWCRYLEAVHRSAVLFGMCRTSLIAPGEAWGRGKG